MTDTHYYEVKVRWTGQRKGTLTSPSLDPLSVATPPEFPQGHPGIWTPEHYFVAAINSCFMTTFLAIAENFKLNYSFFECNSIGKLEKSNTGFMISEVILEPMVTVNDEKEKEKAEKVLLKSEKVCFISNSVKSQILMNMKIRVADSKELNRI